MALIDRIPGARDWYPVAKENGISYETYVARITTGNMPPEVAATKPVRHRERPEDSIRAACDRAGISRKQVYRTRKLLKEQGIDMTPMEIIERWQ